MAEPPAGMPEGLSKMEQMKWKRDQQKQAAAERRGNGRVASAARGPFPRVEERDHGGRAGPARPAEQRLDGRRVRRQRPRRADDVDQDEAAARPPGPAAGRVPGRRRARA